MAVQVLAKNNEIIHKEILPDTILYTHKDIEVIFKCGRKKAYDIMHMSGFPSFKLNTSLYVEKGELEKWLSKNRSKQLFTYK